MAHNKQQLETAIRAVFKMYKALAILDAIQKNALAPTIGVAEEQGDDFRLFVPITKANEDKQEITGLVLQPETVDAHYDIMSAEVIEKAAGDFLASYNKSTTLGLMHKDFKPRFELRQSYISPIDMSIGSSIVKAGTWIMVIKVNDATVWKKIKEGGITGLSIGGKAMTQKLKE